jgi:hypothetical protein
MGLRLRAFIGVHTSCCFDTGCASSYYQSGLRTGKRGLPTPLGALGVSGGLKGAASCSLPGQAAGSCVCLGVWPHNGV